MPPTRDNLAKLQKWWHMCLMNREPVPLLRPPFGLVWYSPGPLTRYWDLWSVRGRWYLYAHVGYFRIMLRIPKSWLEALVVMGRY